ncbi:DJ-1/PfpI family protein [Paenibacillus kobensis]|uniref:DJ-1/PfpI family protein n=1 Tax=Paenibacillus kobensis TaxID=59841 RepID=UPI000FD80B59|nr:DJ-1/PfpI family protein [Paenibacillus kobensis]
MAEARQARNVAILIFDDVEVMDFCGPLEVFSKASLDAYFNVYTVAENRSPVLTANQLSVNPAYSIEDCPVPEIVLVPGGIGAWREMHNDVLTDWIRRMYDCAELVLSVCTGALLLARANLLDGLRITTHHFAYKDLRKAAPPTAELLEGVRYVDNGKVILSGGISAGIDMSFYVVARLLGEAHAADTARRMEYDWKRV